MPRAAGKSKVVLFGSKAWKVFLSGLMSFSSFPIHIIIYGALFGIISAVVLTAVNVLNRHLINPLGWMIVLLLALWSSLMLAIGIVGLFVLRIYHNTTGRPRYIIQDVFDLTLERNSAYHKDK